MPPFLAAFLSAGVTAKKVLSGTAPKSRLDCGDKDMNGA
jgi:hypothetical protein